nr:PhzF family phenazine biosynthesis protein [Maliibacterium massiliense]
MEQFVVDAFTKDVFGGNPAAVCVVDAWPHEGLMQRIAMENRLPETAFVVPGAAPARDAGCAGTGGGEVPARIHAIRWFTPCGEIDLCGHATLASAFVLHRFFDTQARSFHFASPRSGALAAYVDEGRYTLDFPARPAAPMPVLPTLEEALGVRVEQLYRARDYMAVVADERAVRALAPDFLRLRALPDADGVIVTAPGAACDFVSRCFYPACGVDEDPVTGSAHCNLIPYWARRLGKRTLLARQLSARGGTLYCADCGARVRIGGYAALYARAQLTV